jgi:hypothetical protein
MSIWKSLFGKKADSRDEMRNGFGSGDVERVSCMDIVRIIRQQVAELKNSQAMVVVILEGLHVQIFFFDGISRVSWGYNNRQFSTDDVGRRFLVGPPFDCTLSINADSDALLPKVLQREFSDCYISIGKLWRLDPHAWDYEQMKILHGNDVGIRISFDGHRMR